LSVALVRQRRTSSADRFGLDSPLCLIGPRPIVYGVGATAAGVSLTGSLDALTDDEPEAYSTPVATVFDAVVGVFA
jgi:hypothetical protein